MPRLRLVAALLAAVVSAALVPATAGAAPANQDRARILGHWTKERMANAIPRERARPSRGGGGKTTDNRSAVSSPTSLPNRTNGKVFMTMGGTDYVCSGTAVQSQNDSLVWTAGHCLWDAATGYATNVVFVPAYDGTQTNPAPFGRFTAATANLRTTPSYAATSGFVDDFGAARVGTDGGQTLSARLGGERGIDFSPASVLQSYTLFGYPVNRRTGSGEQLWQCAGGTAFADTLSTLTPQPFGVACDWPGGSSGGAWVNAAGNLVTVTSYVYRGIRNVYASDPRPAAQTLWTAMQG
jgi:V8-like Glu-specific endopeptidase